MESRFFFSWLIYWRDIRRNISSGSHFQDCQVQPKVKSAAGYSKADSYNNETYVQLGAKCKTATFWSILFLVERDFFLVKPSDFSMCWHARKIARHGICGAICV